MPLATFLQKKPMLLAVTIVIFLSYQFASLTWTLFSEPETVLAWEPVVTDKTQGSTSVNTRQLQQQHLFGEVAEKDNVSLRADNPSVVNAPKTRLNLKLVGVVAASDPQYSSAIIANKGKQGSYFIDSEIEKTDAFITQIYFDRIILDVKGTYQTLMLDGIEQSGKQNNDKKDRNKHTKRDRKKSTKEKPKTVNLDRDELLENPLKLTDYIKISPVREDGKIKGYSVKPGKDKDLFEQAGLKSGDLAVELNGVDLTDAQQAMGLMQEFPTMTDMSLSIIRDGQLYEMYFSIP